MTTRLICFHHAGGGSGAFRPLARRLGPDVALTAVRLPGHESRLREARHTDVRECAAQINGELGELLDEPHLLLGHSMGALVAYTLARRRQAAGQRGPEALIVSSYAAPHLPSAAARIDSADDQELARALHRFGGLPEEILARPEWLTALMPMVRDDLRICASHRADDGPPLSCPIHLFRGADDPLVAADALAQWARHTVGPAPVTTVPGGHFLFRDPDPALVAGIAEVLRAHGVRVAPAAFARRSPVHVTTRRATVLTTPSGAHR